MPSSGNITFSGCVITSTSHLAHDVARWLGRCDAQEAGVPKLVVPRPFKERDLHDDLGPNPMLTETRQPLRSRERRLRDLECVEPRPELREEPRIETRTNLSGEHEFVAVEVADKERAETGP